MVAQVQHKNNQQVIAVVKGTPASAPIKKRKKRKKRT